jgi:hypothetical protein
MRLELPGQVASISQAPADLEPPALTDPCPSCFEGKQTQATFRTLHTTPPSVLSRISTYLCGPLPLSSRGARYLQVVADEKSQYTAGILLATKS